MEKVKIRSVVDGGVHLTNGVFIPYGEIYPIKKLEDALNVAVTIINALNQ